MSQTQRTVSEIIPKRLSLVERRWTNKNDSETVSFRIRVYSEELKKYNFISLKSTNVKDAKLEGIKLYGTLLSAIETGKPIGNDRRKLSHYITMFMEYTETRCKNGHLTQHRVRCIKQLLVCLEKFAKYKKGSTPILRTLQRSPIMGKRSVYVEEKKVQPGVQTRCG